MTAADVRQFWHERWAQQQIGFHEGKPNELLAAHVDRLERAGHRLRILVPLAGKAVDLWWLAARGHQVVGIELVRQAIDAFFSERGLEPRAEALGAHQSFAASGVTMVCGDFFTQDAALLGPFDALYDRAALIAIEPSMRAAYVEKCRSLLKRDADTLLVSVAYDQSKAPGPPWSVDEPTVRALFAGRAIDVLARRAAEPNPRLAAAGVTAFDETAYLVR